MAGNGSMVPPVSSSTAGPLGAVHLPRLWAKLTLDAAGRLPDDYDACGPGFDQMTCNNLGLDRQKVIDYVRAKRPTYVQFEEWVIANGKTDPETIRKHNAAVHAYHHGEETAGKIRSATGLKRTDVKDAVTLNTLEDLHDFHASVTR